MSLSAIEKRLKQYKRSARTTGKNYLPGWLRRTLWGSIIVGLVIIVAGIAFIMFSVNQSKGVDLEVSAPGSVSRGVPFDLTVNVTNISGASANGSAITITLPSGLLLWGPTASGSVYSENTGDVGDGNLVKKDYKVVPVGNLHSTQTLEVAFSYFNKSGSRFEVKQEVSVDIADSVVNMSISKPDQILNGSAFSFTVNYANNSDFSFPNMTLEADFPSSFQFDSASDPSASLANTFSLGSAVAHATGTIAIKGTFTDSSVSSFTIPLKLFAVLNGQNYEVSDYNATFSLSPSPIGVSVSVNGSDNYIAKPADTLDYSIQYRNQSGIALKDVVVKAVLSGFADWSNVKTDGTYSPSTRTVTWDSSTTPALGFVEPGAIGNLALTLATSLSAPTSIQGLSNKNLYVKVDVSMSSPSVPYYLSGNQTFAETAKETKISSLVYFNAKAYFHDPAGAITNAGPFPPTAGSSTEYTVHWQLSDFGNNLSNAVISAPLPPGVTFTGTSSNTIASSSITFSTSTNSVVWNIGDLYAGSGFLNGPVEGIFQIAATPAASSVGAYEDLLGTSTLQATDDFTGGDINVSSAPLTTLLQDDPTVASGSGVVGQ